MAKLIYAFLGAFEKLRKTTVNFIMSACLTAWNNSAGWIFMKCYIWAFFFENLLRQFKFHYTLTRKTVTLHKDLCTFMISRSLLLRTRNVSGKSCRENQNTILYSITFFFRKLCCLWDNVEKCGRSGQATGDSVIRRMRFPCWIT
jgi:hypothetical protein